MLLPINPRVIALLLVAVCTAACKLAEKPPSQVTMPQLKRMAKAAEPKDSQPQNFRDWLAANPAEGPRFEALTAYLTREGVGEVLPAWQLVQTETVDAATKCEIPGFAVPPQDLWPTIAPTLRLVRDQIVPLLGPVKVLSSFRTNEANRCSSGAPQSPHKRYSALDLAMVDPIPQKEMFAKLCKHWSGLSPIWGYGLGAYYVRGYPAYNQEGRFHVDTLGRRTWGHSYGAYTSHCRELGYIRVKSPEQIKAEEEAKFKAEADALAKTEADAKAKVAADVKAKVDSEALAKAKLKEDVRLKTVAAAKAKAEAETALVKVIVPAAAPPEASGGKDANGPSSPEN